MPLEIANVFWQGTEQAKPDNQTMSSSVLLFDEMDEVGQELYSERGCLGSILTYLGGSQEYHDAEGL